MVNVVIHSSTYFIARLTSAILQMNVATTYQLKKMVTVQDGDCTKFQKLDVQSNLQLTPTSVFKENKIAYSRTTIKQQRKKIQKTLQSCLSISKIFYTQFGFNGFVILVLKMYWNKGIFFLLLCIIWF